MRFLKKLGINLPYDPAIPVLGIYPEKVTVLKDTSTLVFSLKIAKTRKQPRCLYTDEWIKMRYVQTRGYY